MICCTFPLQPRASPFPFPLFSDCGADQEQTLLTPSRVVVGASCFLFYQVLIKIACFQAFNSAKAVLFPPFFPLFPLRRGSGPPFLMRRKGGGFPLSPLFGFSGMNSIAFGGQERTGPFFPFFSTFVADRRQEEELFISSFPRK